MASNCFGFLEEDFGSCFDMLFESQVQEQERNTSCFASLSASLMKDYKNDDCFENVVAAVNKTKSCQGNLEEITCQKLKI